MRERGWGGGESYSKRKTLSFKSSPFEREIPSDYSHISLIRCSLETPKRVIGNSADPDQMPKNAASDQDLHFLQIF